VVDVVLVVVEVVVGDCDGVDVSFDV